MGRNRGGKKKQKKDMSVFKIAGTSKVAKTKAATQKMKTNLKKMNTLTKAKTATVDAAFREVAQDVIMSSAAAPQKSAKCDVKQAPKQQMSLRPPADINAAADQFAQL